MTDRINGRTPEEIKRRLKCASFDCSDIDCDDCEYLDICESVVKRGCAEDALALIERLEAERDAAIKDLPRICHLCKHYFYSPVIKDTKLGKMIIHCDKNCGDARFWEWRGQKKEASK